MQTRIRLFLSVLILCFSAAAPSLDAAPFKGRSMKLPPQKISPGQGTILFDFKVPPHHELAPEAPSAIQVRSKDPAVLRFQTSGPAKMDLNKLPYQAAYTASSGMTVAAADLRIHFCDKETKVCLSDSVRVKFPVEVTVGAPAEIKLTLPLRHKKNP